MLNEEHQKAQQLATEAARLLKYGKGAKAEQKYRKAAKLELDAFLKIPADAYRTRGILSVSAVSMLYKANDFDRAERTIFEMLLRDDITGPHRIELRNLLDVIGDEKIL